MSFHRARPSTGTHQPTIKRVCHATACLKCDDDIPEHRPNMHIGEAPFHRNPRDEQAAIADEITRIIGKR